MTDDSRSNREAMRYRLRLRETETERDNLAARLATIHERTVLDAAADVLAQPRDLIDHGALTVADVLSEDDVIDVEAVKVAATQLATARPGLARYRIASAAEVGLGAAGGSTPSGATWGGIVQRGAVTPTDGR